MTGTLLIPLDGSELGEAALPWAVRLARNQGLSLTLLQVVPAPHFPTGQLGGYVSPSVYDQILETERHAATAYLAELSDRLSLEGETVMTMVRRGAPADVILNMAEKLGVRGIALAGHGRGGLSRLAFGSVAERLIEDATVPLLLVRARADGLYGVASFNRILVPVDGSWLGEDAVQLAKETALPGATILLVRVVEPIEYLATGFDVPVAVLDEDATRNAMADARSYLRRLATSLAGSGLHVEIAVRLGAPGAEILALASEDPANLIVMATHGRTGPARWLAGSVADEVFRASAQPVFLITGRALAAQTVRAAVTDAS